MIYDDLSRGNRWAVKWGPLVEDDIADAVRLRAAHEQYRPAALMHLSAYAYVGELVQKPLLYYRNNFAATATLLHTLTCDWRDDKGPPSGAWRSRAVKRTKAVAVLSG
jgi:UDP-glucose 4-epimerase